MKKCLSRNKVIFVKLPRPTKKAFRLSSLAYGYTNNKTKERDTSETLKKYSDGSTLPYSGANLTTMLSGVTDPIFVLQRVGYPFTLQARNQTEFTTANFDTVWNLLLLHPDQPFGKL